MAKDLYQNLDLNLLRTFLVLSQELNMRKASERLYVSQPAISQSLQKLRNHFSDDLFIKSPKGLTATAYAESLASRLTPLMNELSNTLNLGQKLDLQSIDKPIKIALNSTVLCAISGKIVKEIKKQAPKADLQLLSWSATTLSDIEKGEILIGVNHEISNTSKMVRSEKLLDMNSYVAVRRDHPIKGRITRPHIFADYELASLIVPGWNTYSVIAEEVLNSLGLKAKLGFRSEYLMALVDVIQETDMYLPTTSIFPFLDNPRLRAIKVDLTGIDVNHPLKSHYHQKNTNDPLTQWLNSLIQSLLEKQEQEFLEQFNK
ncbi:LysR family transcriptional regulator [Vibrio hannami]|uniref:LysR family transcriptional regulator n=1 Tax=Vibrio hannami TaxID=2717094 RepID=UPI00240F3A72|nr:LysR family transcriptional regulator [Vibrio hannami]MDG3087211.1 LysR family transcriptional regulator [Vibrio hannami]